MTQSQAAGLCNYFGRHEDLEDIVIRPLLLSKVFLVLLCFSHVRAARWWRSMAWGISAMNASTEPFRQEKSYEHLENLWPGRTARCALRSG